MSKADGIYWIKHPDGKRPQVFASPPRDGVEGCLRVMVVDSYHNELYRLKTENRDLRTELKKISDLFQKWKDLQPPSTD